MDNKPVLEIKEVYGADALRFQQLCCASFHYKKDCLLQEDVAAALEKEDAEARAHLVGEAKTRFKRFCAYKDGQIIAGMTSKPYVSYFDGKPCHMSGIGGVVSDPETRRTGAIRAVFKEIFKDMRANQQWLSHLYPFISDFYRKFGYEVSTDMTTWEIPGDYLPKADNTGIKRYVATEEQKADIKAVVDACRSQFNMAIQLDDTDWESFFKGIHPYTTTRFCYLHYDEAGTPDGVMIYSMHDEDPNVTQVMDVSHGLYFRDPAGLRALLAYAATLCNYFSKLRLDLSAQTDISRILPEMVGGWGKKNVTRSIRQMGLSRVVDVEEILKLAKYRGTGKVTIRVADACCDWNNHCYTVDFTRDSVSVTVTDDAPADIELDIAAFSAMILGRYSIYTCDYLPNVKINGNVEELAKAFYFKPLWIEEHF